MRDWSKRGSRAVQIAGVALVFGFAATPAMASSVATVPLPGTLSLLGIGIAGVAIANRLRRRK